MMKRFLNITISILLIFGFVGALTASEVNESLETINYYFDLIRSGNAESAIMFWGEADLQMAERLGIVLKNSDFKIDCNSPVIADRKEMNGFSKYNLGSQVKLPGGAIRWKVRSTTISPDVKNRTNYYYYAAKKGDSYWLISPYSYYSSDWKTIESEYFKFFLHPKAESKFNQVAADELDRFVAKLAGEFGLSENQIANLKTNKLYYYLCPNTVEVRKITGYNLDSYYDQSVDAITSNGMSAYSTVVEQLINYKLGEIDYATSPFIKFGLATMLGGEESRNPEVIIDFGDYLIDFGVIELDSILAFNPLYDSVGLSDIIMPGSACLSEYIYHTYGIDKTLEIYKNLSGEKSTIEPLPVDTIKSIIEQTTAKEWTVIEKEFTEFLNMYSQGKAGISPGISDQETDIVVLDSSGVRMAVSNRIAQIECRLDNPDSSFVDILFNRVEFPPNYSSKLYRDQRGGKNIDQFRYCIRIDKNEIGLYDYAVNRVLAKFINNRGLQNDYFNRSDSTIKAFLSADYFDPEVIKNGDYKIVR